MLCYPKHNPMNYEHGWCHTKVSNLVAKIRYKLSKNALFQGNYYVMGKEEEITENIIDVDWKVYFSWNFLLQNTLSK